MTIGNTTNITPPRVSLIDERTGAVSREWYRWFYSLFTTLGSGTGIVPVDAGGTGLGTIPTNGQLLIGNGTGYTLNTLGYGVGISVTNGIGTIVVANTGVLSNIAGAGISVSSATGNVTIANTGVLSWSGGSTGLTPATATTGAVALGGLLAIGYGGTNGTATPTAGAVSYGTGTAYAFTAAGTAGQVLTSAGASVPTWTTPTTGTVTSVGLAMPVQFTVTNSPVTSSGTLTAAWTTQSANVLLAGPTSGAGAVPTFRALTTADIPALPYGTGTVTSVGFTGGIVSIATPTTTPAFTIAGTSGGVPYFSSGTTWASSAALAANALVIGGGAGAAPSTTTTGTGVVTALGVNTGTAGAFVVNGGALGTPSSGVVTNLTGTASININGTVGATTPNAGTFTSLSDSGNLTFTGTGNRITGDFSNATVANRIAFQTSTVNGNSFANIIPNGTGTSAGFIVYSTSDLSNAAFFTHQIVGGSDARFNSSITGTGTYLPMTFYTSGSEKLRIAADTTGTYTFGGTAPRITGDFSNATLASRVAFQTSTVNSSTAIPVLPNGTSTNAQLQIYNNSDPTNGSFLQLAALASSVNIYSSIQGTGTYLPMTFYTGGSERVRIDISGNVLVTSAGGSLGYGTGSGGTVTQATSRTTGVTLSKPTGAITMFSAAGSVVAATFTVTNTLVAATDTIILNQKSGTNLYVLLVTAVAAGSFNITFYTTGGVATDAPVINFAIIKGATA